MDLTKYIRDIPNFPKKGIMFKDITPLLKDPKAFAYSVNSILRYAKKQKADSVCAVESRGFIFGSAVAAKGGLGFIPIRKKGKLPHKTVSKTYDLEYGHDTIQIHSDAFKKGERVILVDDLLATGGTALASCKLIELVEAKVCGVAFVIELGFLNGRSKLDGYPMFTMITY